MKRTGILLLPLCAVLLAGCSTTRSLKEGEFRLAKNYVKVDDKSFNQRELQTYISQKPNTYLIGEWNPFLSLYNLSGQDDTKPLNRFLRKIGQAPVVYDPTKVDASIESMLNHLEYIGYYGSEVESDIRVHKKKVYVTYYVELGKRFVIDSVSYALPPSEEFREDFFADEPNVTVRSGQYLAASALEEETARGAAYFRTKGYYGFDKSQYVFEADTLKVPGHAFLKMSILEHGRNEPEENSVPPVKYSLGDVRISYSKDLPLRKSLMENLNMLRPGEPYNELAVNRTYSRLASLNLFSGVNISMDKRDSAIVDCDIRLRHSQLQGFKVNLEASTNSSGLIGISPQITYYHKNIFKGGERLNIGLKGNFQFKPKHHIRSTEFGASTSITFPKFLGIPTRLFPPSSSVPKTDIATSFNYQNRPEYTRTIISGSFGYSGSMGSRFFFQFFPIQANIVRMFDIDPDFREQTQRDPFMRYAYQSHFDAGLGTILYYTTDASVNPKDSYHYYRLGVDLSGNVLSLLNNAWPTDASGAHLVWGSPYSQYVRGEAQIGRTFVFGKGDAQAVALRLVAGAGYAYGNSSYLPFEKAFYAGGASSLRGWQARTVGPGNSKMNEYFIIPNQTGDLKLEFNAEYRFPMFWKFDGALFIDAGNIWSLYGSAPEEAKFKLSTLPQSVAMDWGTGIRLDLDFILVRIDMGFRLHDPVRDPGDRWINPFSKAIWKERSSIYALHFGVGYPF
ncbi:MAG: BamA/TamA family outer membrane protein [Bacteroidales bacterium]|nr:BamA/TamA family outer membrane protein [Bacteroidales bacterium]